MDTGNTRRARRASGTRDARRAFGTGGAMRAFTTTVASALAGALAAALRPIAGARGVGRALAGALLVGGVLGLAQGAQGQTTFTVTGPASITETDANQNLVFTVTRSGAALTAASTTVGWAITHDGTDGTNAADFGAVSGSVVFAAGEDAQQFLLTVIGDNDAEEDEGFTLQVSHGTHSVGAAYDGEIVGDDTHFILTGPASMLENDGQASPDFTFTRTGAELPEQYIVTGDGGDVPPGAPRRGVYGTATLPRGGGPRHSQRAMTRRRAPRSRSRPAGLTISV